MLCILKELDYFVIIHKLIKPKGSQQRGDLWSCHALINRMDTGTVM